MESSRARLLPTFPTLVEKRKRHSQGWGGLLYRRPRDSSAALEGNMQDEGSRQMARVDHRTDQGAR